MNKLIFTRKHTNIAKGVAIILMLFYHLFETEQLITSNNVAYSPIPQNIFLLMSGFGNICVAVFVVLTGYGLAAGLFSQWRVSGNTSTNKNSFAPDMISAYTQAAKRFLKLMLSFLALFVSLNVIWFYKLDYTSVYGSGKQSIPLLLSDATGLSHILNTPTMCDTWWYMKLAYLLILIVPLLAFWAAKTGYGGMLLIAVLPFTFDLGLDLNRYLICALVGVYAAYGDWFGKLINRRGLIVIRKSGSHSNNSNNVSIFTPILNWVILILVLVLSVIIRDNAIIHDYFLSIINAAIALFLIWGSSCVIGSFKPLGIVLEYLGKYSMNIYLIHSFFYMMLWQKFIYSPKYAILILLLLLTICFAYSFILEVIKMGIKKIYQYLKSRRNSKH